MCNISSDASVSQVARAVNCNELLTNARGIPSSERGFRQEQKVCRLVFARRSSSLPRIHTYIKEKTVFAIKKSANGRTSNLHVLRMIRVE